MVDYQQIIDLCADLISYALPLGLCFCVSEWILNTFFGFVFGKKYIKGE